MERFEKDLQRQADKQLKRTIEIPVGMSEDDAVALVIKASSANDDPGRGAPIIECAAAMPLFADQHRPRHRQLEPVRAIPAQRDLNYG